MKVDFKNKTIEINDSIKVKELLELINKHNLQDFTIISKEKENIFIPQPIPDPWAPQPCPEPYYPIITMELNS